MHFWGVKRENRLILDFVLVYVGVQHLFLKYSCCYTCYCLLLARPYFLIRVMSIDLFIFKEPPCGEHVDDVQKLFAV